MAQENWSMKVCFKVVTT